MTTEARQIAVRLDGELIEAIERWRVELEQRAPGLTVGYSDAMRSLLILGLTRAGEIVGAPLNAVKRSQHSPPRRSTEDGKKRK